MALVGVRTVFTHSTCYSICILCVHSWLLWILYPNRCHQCRAPMGCVFWLHPNYVRFVLCTVRMSGTIPSTGTEGGHLSVVARLTTHPCWCGGCLILRGTSGRTQGTVPLYGAYNPRVRKGGPWRCTSSLEGRRAQGIIQVQVKVRSFIPHSASNSCTVKTEVLTPRLLAKYCSLVELSISLYRR